MTLGKSIVALAVLILCCSGSLLADPITLNVPGSVPGTTTVFATDRGYTVGTYEFSLGNFGDATYGFIFDGTNYTTFMPEYYGPPPSAGTLLFPVGPDSPAFDQVHILSFNETGGIGIFVNNPLNGEDVDCCGFVLAAPGGGTFLNLRQILNPTGDSGITVLAPDGFQAPVTYDTWSYPTYINDIGQVEGNFTNCSTDPCNAITPGGQFLISGGQLYLNYTTWGDATLYGIPAGETVTGFVENADGTFTPVAPVPEPSTWLLLASGLVGIAFLKRRVIRTNASTEDPVPHSCRSYPRDSRAWYSM